MTNRRSHPTPLTAVLVLALSACAGPGLPSFHHDVTTQPAPWTHQRFDTGPERFTFALFSDLNGGERMGVFRVAVEQLSLLRPELIVSVGDLIDGGIEDRSRLTAEWDAFDARAERTTAPVFYTGGNHDLTNRTMRHVWAERYGPRYYHFVYKGVLFLVLDSEDFAPERMREIYRARAAALEALDAGAEDARQMEYFQMPERMTGEIRRDQAAYFQRAVEEHPDVRWTFLIMHKPVWKAEDEPEFAAIEAALENRPYTVFNGHEHTFSHTVKNGRQHITLGTTGGGQNPDRASSFDHVTLVTMTDDGPSIAHLRMDGILDPAGGIPAGGDTLCYQASRCGPGTPPAAP